MSQHYNGGQWHNVNPHPPRPFYPTSGDSAGPQRDASSSGQYQSHDAREANARPFVPRASTDLAIVPRHTDAQPDIRQDGRLELSQSASQDGYYGFSNPYEDPAYHGRDRGPIYQLQPTSMGSPITAPYVPAHRPEGSQGTRSEPGGQYLGSGSDYRSGSNREIRGVSQAPTQPFSPYGVPGDGGRDVPEPERADKPRPEEARYSPPHRPVARHPYAPSTQSSHPSSYVASHDMPPPGPFYPPRNAQQPLQPQGPFPSRPPPGDYSPPQTESAGYHQSSPPGTQGPYNHRPLPPEPFHPSHRPLQPTMPHQPPPYQGAPLSGPSQPPRLPTDEYDLPTPFSGPSRRSPDPDEDKAFQVRIRDSLDRYARVKCKVDTGNETGYHLISTQMTGGLGFAYDSYSAPRVGSIDTLGGTAQTVGSIRLRWRVEMDGQIHPREDWFEIFDRADFPYDVIFSPSVSGALPGAAAAPDQKTLMMVVMGKKKMTQEESQQQTETNQQRQIGREESRRRRDDLEQRRLLEQRERRRQQQEREEWERERERAERQRQEDWERRGGGENWENPPQRPAPSRWPREQQHQQQGQLDRQTEQQHQRRYQGQLSRQRPPPPPHPEWPRGQHGGRHYT